MRNQIPLTLLISVIHSTKHWNTIFFVDGSNRADFNLLKVAFDESLNREPNDVNLELMKILPVNFTSEHKKMLCHLHVFVNKGYLSIPSQHDKLITSLRTAYATEYSLNKDQTSYNDLLDSLRLSLRGYTSN
jgi:hypothetical protein